MSASNTVVDKSTAATLLASCKTKEDVLTLIVAGSITIEQASARITELMPKAHSAGKLSIKVSEKGAVSVYGGQRVRVTLYSEQWERLLGIADELKKFMADNKSKLATKGDKSTSAA